MIIFIVTYFDFTTQQPRKLYITANSFSDAAKEAEQKMRQNEYIFSISVVD